MKIFRFIKSKTFVLNVVVLIALGFVILYATNAFLKSFTHHDETIVVPDLNGMTLAEASEKLGGLALTFEVIDSAEYNPKVAPRGIVDQYPEAFAEVKEHRAIKLTVNPLQPRKVGLPDLIDKTKRRATYDLESKGLVVGELIYRPNLAKDVVLSVEKDGEPIEAGTPIAKGTVVDLILGLGQSKEKISVPYVKYLTLAQAKEELIAHSLNVGVTVFDEDVVDSSAALVYKQSPPPSHKNTAYLGSSIDIWLTADKNKIVNDSLLYFAPDTTAHP
ncbi:MAG: hypothetical protein SchgKO_18020 [Schleiferiaceae bacterium]